MQEKITPLVHNNWDPLEEIWLGDVYPENFYDDLEPDIRDSFRIITQWTKEDLSIIQKKFEEFNVIVKRPNINLSKEIYTVDKNKKILRKPPICPRDNNGVVADKLFSSHLFEPALQDLVKDYNNVYSPDTNVPSVTGANMVKLGKDIIFDFPIPASKEKVFKHFYKFTKLHGSFFSDYRLMYSRNGGHCDGCFMPIKPGLFLATKYWKEYDLTMPGWDKIEILNPSYITAGREFVYGKDYMGNGHNGRWINFIENMPPHFNKFVYEKCKDWTGNYKETYFEVNIVMIDEKNMLCIDSAKANEPIYEALEKHGVTCHIVPWRTRGFWDGGLHCITLDVKRKAKLEDYFPERGGPGIKTIISNNFFNSQEAFFTEYNSWLETKTTRELNGYLSYLV